MPETEHLKSRAALLIQMARRENLTLRQLFHRVAAARGHLLPIGTPLQVADTLERWFREGGADGFNVMPPFFPGQFDLLRRASCRSCRSGLFRADYTGTTLRDHLGLARPAIAAAFNHLISISCGTFRSHSQGSLWPCAGRPNS